MAIVRMGSVVGGISGRVGGVVFAGGRAGAVAKAAGRRVGGQTTRAMAAQSVPSAVAGAWNALTDAQRASWRTAAASLQRTNRLGMGRQISGWQLYFAVIVPRYGSSPPAAFLPPANLLEVRPAWLQASWWSGGPYVIWSYGDPWPTTVPQRYVYVHRFRGASQQGGFDRPVRVAVGAKAGLGEDIYAAVVAAGVEPITSERLGVGVRWQIGTGIVGGRVWVPITMDAAGAIIEDWETGDLPAYTGNTANAALVALPVHGGQSALRMQVYSAANVVRRIVAVDKIRGVPVRGLVSECWVRHDAGVNDFSILIGVQDGSNYYNVSNYWSPYGMAVYKVVAGVSSLLGHGGANVRVNDTWYRIRVSWSTAGVIVASAVDAAGVVLGSVTVTDNTYTAGGIGYQVGNVAGSTANGYYDDWTVTAKV
jgi:hypothetical protein